MSERTSTDHPYLRECAPYLAGALDPGAEQEFERHLGGCTLCLDECDRLAPVALGLAGIAEEPVRALADAQLPAAASTGRAEEAEPSPVPLVTVTVHTEEAKPSPVPPRRMRRGRRRFAMAALAAVAAVSFGIAFTLPTGDEQAVNSRQVAATAVGTGGSAELSVTVTRAGEQLHVEATVTGLTEDQTHRLYAVTTAGDSAQVAEWTAGPGTHHVYGEVAVDLERLAFFSVTLRDGTAVVSAPLARN